MSEARTEDPQQGTARRHRVAMAVPTLNAGPRWSDWLRALAAQVPRPDRCLVIDSGSDDGTPARAAAAGLEVRRIDRAEFDHGGTRQWAADLVRDADILVFLTQDAVLADASAVANLVRAFDDPAVGAAYGRQLPRSGAGPLEAHARLFNYPAESLRKTAADGPRLGLKTVFISNSFAAYRLEALRSIGGFEAGLILSEDTHASARLLLDGWAVAYRADAAVYHSHGYTLAEETRRYFDVGVFHAREPWIRQRFAGAEGEGARYVRSEIRFLWRHAPALIPVALVRDAAKLLAYRLGLAERWLPRGLKRRLSMHRGFWRCRDAGAGRS